MYDTYKDEKTMRKIYDEILKFLVENKKNVKRFWNNAQDHQLAFLQNGCVVGQTWDGPILTMKKEGKPVSYMAPKEGAITWVDSMCTVGFYVDDVYYSTFDTELLDVERIEVLRGPQGSLYGRNTEAGIINIISKSPGNDFWQGLASVEAANYNTQVFRANLAGPLVEDKLFIRVAGKQRLSDGYFNNTYLDDKSADDINDFDGRASVLWTPTENWDIKFTANMQKYRDGNASFNTLDQVRETPHDVAVDYNGLSDYDANSQALNIRHSSTYFDFTSITAYRTETSTAKND